MSWNNLCIRATLKRPIEVEKQCYKPSSSLKVLIKIFINTNPVVLSGVYINEEQTNINWYNIRCGIK